MQHHDPGAGHRVRLETGIGPGPGGTPPSSPLAAGPPAYAPGPGYPPDGGPGYPQGPPQGPGYPPGGGGYPPRQPGGYGGPPGGYGGPPDYGAPPPPRRGGISPALVAGGAVLLLLLLAIGALFALQIGPLAPAATTRPSGVAFVTPRASPSGPASTASAAPTVAPTPTDEPTDESSAGASPRTPAQEELFATIPHRLRESCTPRTPPAVEPDVIAVYGCENEGTFFRYSLYESEEEMQAQYNADLFHRPLRRPPGDDCEEGASEHPYTIQGEEVGRLFCYDDDGSVVFEWTDPRVNVLTDARSDEDYAALYEFWRTAGPDSPAGQ